MAATDACGLLISVDGFLFIWLTYSVSTEFGRQERFFDGPKLARHIGPQYTSAVTDKFINGGNCPLASGTATSGGSAIHLVDFSMIQEICARIVRLQLVKKGRVYFTCQSH